MKLSKHFDSSEFACRCGCGFDDVSPELIKVLEDLRTTYDRPITITSGCRCEAHNKKVGGAQKTDKSPGSQHLYGTAADIKVEGMSPAKVYQYLQYKYPNKYGLGLYKSWVHVDVRPTPVRWVK